MHGTRVPSPIGPFGVEVVTGRRRGGNDVVEAAVGFVVVDDEHSLAEHFGVRHQDVEHLRDVPGAIVDRPGGVLGVAGRRDHPRDLGQRTVLHVGLELVEQAQGPGLPGRGRGAGRRLGGRQLRAGAGIIEQRAARAGRRILGKVQQRIIGEIAVETVGWASVPEVRRERGACQVLIDSPGHARLVQHFRKRLPGQVVAQRTEAVAGNRARSEAIRSGCAQIIDVSNATGPEVAPIRICRAHDRTVVIVQHREGVGQREVIGNVVAREVGHSQRALLDRPAVILP